MGVWHFLAWRASRHVVEVFGLFMLSKANNKKQTWMNAIFVLCVAIFVRCSNEWHVVTYLA